MKNNNTPQPATEESLTPQPAPRVIDVPLKVTPRELSERRTSQPAPMQPAPGETSESAAEMLVCGCDEFWPGQGHHPDCPVLRYITTLERQRDQAREELAAANADRVRLRSVLELIQPMVNAIPAELWEDSDNVAIPINQALSTPPPETPATPSPVKH